MSRLTFKHSVFSSDCWEIKEVGNELCNETCSRMDDCEKCPIAKAIDKLAEYEDLEEQGLLLRLPCKVGDTLYIIEPRFYNYEKHEGVQKGICKGYELNDRYGWVVKVELEKGGKNTLYFYNFSKFGKTVFLTREEAEAKLKEMEG